MATVYRSHDLVTGESVALKVLKNSVEGTADVPRFVREARVLAELRHPGIVRYIAHGTTLAGELYLAMEWLDGEDLAQRLERAPLSLAESVRVATSVADTLAVLHGRGIVHRDIKPENLFLVGGDITRVKLLDLGLVRQGRTQRATQEGVLLGTPGYMSPEQVRGAREIDARADIFALGCVLFECLVGHCPFENENVVTLLGRTLLEDSPRVRTLRTDIPAELDDIVAAMLTRDVVGRPVDGAALGAMLRGLGPLTPFDPDLPTVPPVVFPPSLGVGERRLLSIILVAAAEGPHRGPLLDRPVRDTTDVGLAPRNDLRPTNLEDSTRPGVGRGDGGPTAATLQLAAESFGAQFELLADGSAMAALHGRQGMGPPTDQVARAARCALALRGFAPASRMAVATGWGEVSGRWPVGEVLDRAARLLRDAPRDAPRDVHGKLRGDVHDAHKATLPVRVDDVTAGLLDGRFDVDGETVGLDLHGEREVVESARPLLGRPTPCVGRRRELTTLAALLDECLEEPVARAVLITALPGMGKTRLRQEFVAMARRRAPALKVWTGRGDPVREGAPFGMLAAPLRALAGMHEGEALNVRRQKLRARVARHVAPEEATRVTEFLGEILGTQFSEDTSVTLGAARQDALWMGDQMRQAFIDMLRAECTEAPILLVLEDLQWGDIPSVQYIDAALRALTDQAFMVLAVGRPEVHASFSGLWSERGLQEIRLGELTRKASEELARAVLGPSLDTATLDRIVDRSAGNALFLEEILRSVAAGRGLAVPGSVLAMMYARLDVVTPDARRALRAAAIFGQHFWRSAVAALLGIDPGSTRLGDWLNELCDREVIFRRLDARFVGHDEYGFRHATLRDAAYATLTESDLTLGHRLAGAWLEHTGEGDAVVLGEHFERGAVPDQAVTWYCKAAEQALEGNDLGSVLARTERGVACGAHGAVLGALRLLQTEAHIWRGEYSDAVRGGREALRWLPRGSPRWLWAVGETAMAYGKQGDKRRLEALASGLRDVAPGVPPVQEGAAPWVTATARLAIETLEAGMSDLARGLFVALESAVHTVVDHPAAEAQVHQARAAHAMASGEPAVARTERSAAIRCFEAVGDFRRGCAAGVDAGFAALALGDNTEAEKMFSITRDEAIRLRLQGVTAAAGVGLAETLARRGALTEAMSLAQACAMALGIQADRRMEGMARRVLARVALGLGDPTTARTAAAEAVRLLPRGSPARALALATQSEIETAVGDMGLALALAVEAVVVVDRLGEFEGDVTVRLAHAEALTRAGREDEAHRAIDRARGTLLDRAGRMGNNAWSESFMTQVPVHARTMALAENWLGEIPSR